MEIAKKRRKIKSKKVKDHKNEIKHSRDLLEETRGSISMPAKTSTIFNC